MSKKKRSRWSSRPKETGNHTYSKYRKPDAQQEMYHIERKPKQPSPAIEQHHHEQTPSKKRDSSLPKKKAKKKVKIRVTKKYQSAPAPVHGDDVQIEQRRAQREKKRKRKNMLLRLSVACIFLVVTVVVCIFVFFKIGKIKVEGSEKYTAAQVIEASGTELGDNLYTPTAASIQAKLDKQLPYIYAVSLKHELPDTLVICVKETQAVYAFKSTNKQQTRFLLTDSDLKLLEVVKEAPKHCAVIEGASLKGADIGEKATFKEAEKGEMIQKIHTAFTKNHLDDISAINVSNIINITVTYADALRVEIGQANNLDYKCKLAAGAIEDVLKENKKATGTINVKQAAQTKQAYYKP